MTGDADAGAVVPGDYATCHTLGWSIRAEKGIRLCFRRSARRTLFACGSPSPLDPGGSPRYHCHKGENMAGWIRLLAHAEAILPRA
jgi:hypothetical protein